MLTLLRGKLFATRSEASASDILTGMLDISSGGTEKFIEIFSSACAQLDEKNSKVKVISSIAVLMFACMKMIMLDVGQADVMRMCGEL